VACAICGGDGFEVVVPSRRDPTRPIDLQTVFRSSGDEPLQDQMVRCAGCGLHYVRPRLKWELILAGYEGGTDASFVSQAAFRERTFRKSLGKLERMARPPGRRVLDVGAAGGSFLAAARERGYEPLGCEPSTWMCAFAREHYGLELHPGTLFDMPLSPASLDLLTLWDVIEHTPDPKAVLRRAHELLKPDGVLAMSWPDYGSLAARLLGSRWPFLLTVHLYYFTPRTMTALLRKTGFEPVGYTPYLQTLEMGYVGQRAAPYLGPLGGLLTGALRALRLQRLPFQYWVGQTMVVARKAPAPAARGAEFTSAERAGGLGGAAQHPPAR
jgi:SAM-dependent methyltransferase